MNQVQPRSRLARQENKRLLQQTLIIIGVTIGFIILFFTVGLPGLMKLAVSMGDAKSTSIFNQQEDTLAPLPPQISPLTEATKETTITIEGYAESGTVVSLFHNTSFSEETTADTEGKFFFTNVTLQEGQNAFYTTAKDTVGNESQPSPTQTVVFDEKPPELTINTPKEGAKIFGLLEQLTDVSGETESGAQVTLNERVLVVTGSGSFSTKYELSEGENKLKIVATDKAGNQTEQELIVHYSK